MDVDCAYNRAKRFLGARPKLMPKDPMPVRLIRSVCSNLPGLNWLLVTSCPHNCPSTTSSLPVSSRRMPSPIAEAALRLATMPGNPRVDRRPRPLSRRQGISACLANSIAMSGGKRLLSLIDQRIPPYPMPAATSDCDRPFLNPISTGVGVLAQAGWARSRPLDQSVGQRPVLRSAER